MDGSASRCGSLRNLQAPRRPPRMSHEDLSEREQGVREACAQIKGKKAVAWCVGSFFLPYFWGIDIEHIDML